jgi:hypothetical protein
MVRGRTVRPRLSPSRDSLRLERVFLDTGQRKLFKELVPTDRAGLLSLRGVFVTDDLRAYAYTAYHQVSSLFVSEARPARP